MRATSPTFLPLVLLIMCATGLDQLDEPAPSLRRWEHETTAVPGSGDGPVVLETHGLGVWHVSLWGEILDDDDDDNSAAPETSSGERAVAGNELGAEREPRSWSCWDILSWAPKTSPPIA